MKAQHLWFRISLWLKRHTIELYRPSSYTDTVESVVMLTDRQGGKPLLPFKILWYDPTLIWSLFIDHVKQLGSDRSYLQDFWPACLKYYFMWFFLAVIKVLATMQCLLYFLYRQRLSWTPGVSGSSSQRRQAWRCLKSVTRRWRYRRWSSTCSSSQVGQGTSEVFCTRLQCD